MRDSARGFTLLEIMVALAILGLTLVVMLEIVTNNNRATHHARMTTTATFLARQKMVEVEDDVLYQGFTNSDQLDNGNFKNANLPQYRWETLIERVELPTDLAQKTQDASNTKAQNSKDPMSMMSGMMGGIMSSFVDPIRIGLQESVRRVTVRVIWDEAARPNQILEVVQYLTDPAKLQLINTAGGMPAGGATGQPTTPGAPGAPRLPTGIPGMGR